MYMNVWIISVTVSHYWDDSFELFLLYHLSQRFMGLLVIKDVVVDLKFYFSSPKHQPHSRWSYLWLPLVDSFVFALSYFR